ncbi:MAG: class I SAM-dependent methyltransferase [Patescibacteria group bacterium]
MKEKTVKKILESTLDLYNKIADDFYQTRKKPWPIIDLIKSHINKANNIVDLGCGSGRLSELVSDNQNYLGLDNSASLIKIAQNNYSNRKNINFQVLDIINNELPNKKFDLALMIAVIHHLPTKELRLKILNNIKESLTDDGLLIITSWNLWQKDYRRHLFNYRLKITKYKIFSFNDAFIPWQQNQSRYVHSFSKGELKKLLKKAGFEVKEVFYEYRGEKTSRFKGKNLIVIAEKINQ